MTILNDKSQVEKSLSHYSLHIEDMVCEMSFMVLPLLQARSAEKTVTKTKHNYNNVNMKQTKESASTPSNTKHRTYVFCVKLQ